MNEKEMEKQIRKIKRQNTIIFVVFIAMAMTAIIFFVLYQYQHTFTTDKWNANTENRTKIVGDLLDKYQLIGMQEADIIDLLGEEDSEQSSFKISGDVFPPDTTLVYYIGVDFMHVEWLILSLKDGVVYDYCIDVS